MGLITRLGSVPPRRSTARKGMLVLVSAVVHVLGAAAFAVVPLVATGALPLPEFVFVFRAGPLPPAPVAEPVRPRPDATRASSVTTTPAPVVSQTGPDLETPQSLATQASSTGLGTVTASVGMTSLLAAPPSPAEPATTPPDLPVRTGGLVKEPRKVFDAAPVYSPIAKAARLEGDVILEATIARDGTVKETRVLRSGGMLDAAALAAVRQWRYSPSLLNGIPVEVLMTVTVRFTLR